MSSGSRCSLTLSQHHGWSSVFPSPRSFSPGLQCRSWPSLLSGPTMGSEYLAICIHMLTVQHVLFHLVPDYMHAIYLSLYHFVFFVLSLRRVCVCSELRRQLWILAQHRWLPPQLAVICMGWKGMHVCHFPQASGASFPHICLCTVAFFSFLRLEQNGLPRASLRSMPVRPPDQFGELISD